MRVEGRYLKREYTIGRLHVAPLTPLIGACVRLDLRAALATEDKAAIVDALGRHKVLFFPKQRLSLSDLVAFGRAFGTLQRYAPGVPPMDGAQAAMPQRHPEVHVFDYGESQRGREAFWHFDVLPSRRPARASILRAHIVPGVGGDTLFCDLAAVYDSLSDARKQQIEDAIGIYDWVFERRLARARGQPESDVMAISPVPLDAIPLVARHPADGRRVLFVNPAFLVGIEALRGAEPDDIIADVRARIDRPEFQCRFRWQAGDVAFWDNLACLHYATNNYWPARRVMQRITLIDDEATAPS